MKSLYPLSILLVILCSVCAGEELFQAKPWLQLGDSDSGGSVESLIVMWLTPDIAPDEALPTDSPWSVEYQVAEASGWRRGGVVRTRKIVNAHTPKHLLHSATLTRLAPGVEFDYRVLNKGREVFTAKGKSRSSRGQPVRFAVFGDCGTNAAGQRAIIHQVARWNPDFFFIPGDIMQAGVGRMSEYWTNWFPIVNSDVSAPDRGAPLARSRISLAALGNHDVGADFDKYDDGLGYYVYWSFPLNGPFVQRGDRFTTPLNGNPDRHRSLLSASGQNYPRMNNYSFEYGDTKWIVIDSNAYMDWRDYELRAWLLNELQNSNALWKIVSFHHAPFSSNTGNEFMEMAVVADILEKGGADIVFSGHVHAYQRTAPLRFLPEPGPNHDFRKTEHTIHGSVRIDKSFDGKSKTLADGVIYIITGAGGSGLDEAQLTDRRTVWNEFTVAVAADRHSFTWVEVDGRTMEVKQVDKSGDVIDAFRLTKSMREKNSKPPVRLRTVLWQ